MKTRTQRLSALLLAAMLLTGITACGSTAGETPSVSAEGPASAGQASAEEPATAPADEQAAPAGEEGTPEEAMVSDEAAGAVEDEPVAGDVKISSIMDYPLTDEDVTLTYWTAGDASDIETYFTGQQVYLAIQEATGISLEFQVVSMQASAETFNLIVASGEYPDLIANVGSFYTQGISSAISEEIVIDLAEYLDDYMPDYKTILESNRAYMKSVQDENGSIGVAANLLQDGYPVTNGPVIRQDWLDALGLDIPVTYDDYHDVLTAFKNDIGADAPMWIPFMGSIAGSYLAAGFGVASYNLPQRSEDPFYQIDGTVYYGPAEDGYLDYLTLLHDWYAEGLIDQDFMSATDPRLPDSSKIAEGHTGLWYDMTTTINSYDVDDPDFRITPIADAVQQPGDVNHLRGGDSVIDAGQGISVSTACGYPELAAGLLNYNYTEAGVLLTNFGVEGVSYNIVDGEPVFSDMILNNPDGLTVNDALSVYTMSKGNVYDDGSKYLQTYDDLQVAATQIWATSDNDYAIPVGAIFTSAESEAYSAVYNDISTIVSEMTLKFIVGDADLAEFEAYTASLYDTGLQNCIDLKQAALDRYNA